MSFDEYLTKHKYAQHNVKQLIIYDPLEGEVDLSTLQKDPRYKNVRALHFHPGEITSLKNIPKQLKILSISHQSLTKCPSDLPSCLSELYISFNPLQDFAGQLKKCDELKVLHASDISLQTNGKGDWTEKNLPKSLEYIDLTNIAGDLGVLDFHSFSALKTLKVGRKAVVLVRDDFIGLQSDPEVVVERIGQNADGVVDVDREEIHEIVANNMFERASEFYYKLKSDWEKDGRDKCVVCGKKGGSIFESRKTHIIARCGNKESPCKFHIELDRGDSVSHLQEAQTVLQKELDDLEQEIICDKMMFVMKLRTEKESTSHFKMLWERIGHIRQKFKVVSEMTESLFWRDKSRDKAIEVLSEQIQSLQERCRDLLAPSSEVTPKEWTERFQTVAKLEDQLLEKKSLLAKQQWENRRVQVVHEQVVVEVGCQETEEVVDEDEMEEEEKINGEISTVQFQLIKNYSDIGRNILQLTPKKVVAFVLH